MLPSEKNIVLTGFMGSGKSMTSRKLEEFCHRPVVSTDALIEEREGRPITAIFADAGETYFRQVEKAVVREIAAQQNLIIDCGGGVVLDDENMACLRKSGTIFYLSASPECIFENVKRTKHRPLLDVADPLAQITELFNQRLPYYQKADVIIDADFKSIDQIAHAVWKEFCHE